MHMQQTRVEKTTTENTNDMLPTDFRSALLLKEHYRPVGIAALAAAARFVNAEPVASVLIEKSSSYGNLIKPN